MLTTAADYETYAIADSAAREPAGRGAARRTFVAITPAANARGAQNYMTSETDYGDARTSYWHGVDFTATARLANGLTLQGGTSTGRGRARQLRRHQRAAGAARHRLASTRATSPRSGRPRSAGWRRTRCRRSTCW